MSYSLSHLTDRDLLRDLAALVAQDRTTTAVMLAHMAEVDARRLYLPAAYSSMYDYCVGELRLSEDVACKRIRAARAAREFPAIFVALAEGRLHLTAVVLLAPYLNAKNVDELLTLATHKTKAEIEQLLAQRCPRPDVPARIEAIAPDESAQVPVDSSALGRIGAPAPVSVDVSTAPSPIDVPRPRVAALAPERFALQLTMSQSTHDKLRYAQALLSHRVPSGDLAVVLDLALDSLIGQLEKSKFAAATKPRPRSCRSSANPRTIPAHVRRTVWQRDHGQCTFVSETGHRCTARKFVEFDHVDPVARGGQASVERVRLRCRAHNQYEAECTFGAGFMTEKRDQARHAAEEARAQRAAAAARERVAAALAQARAAAQEQTGDVMACLRNLGFRAEEARRAAESCENPDAPLEERVRAALKFLCPKRRSQARIGTSLGVPA